MVCFYVSFFYCFIYWYYVKRCGLSEKIIMVKKYVGFIGGLSEDVYLSNVV